MAGSNDPRHNDNRVMCLRLLMQAAKRTWKISK